MDEQQEILINKLPEDISILETTEFDGTWYEVSYTCPDKVLNLRGELVSKYSFSSKNRNKKTSLENLLSTLKANDIGYDEALRGFIK